MLGKSRRFGFCTQPYKKWGARRNYPNFCLRSSASSEIIIPARDHPKDESRCQISTLCAYLDASVISEDLKVT